MTFKLPVSVRTIETIALILSLAAWLAIAIDVSLTGYAFFQVVGVLIAAPLTSIAERGGWL